MRSSKSRSRSKSNRNRPAGNIVNRVFDSNGPEGKVRGTPQQVIDKYNQLARDAQLSGDRVALENFQQHAEHYMRMLNEALRDQREAQERREQQDRDRGQRGDGSQQGGDGGQQGGDGGQQGGDDRGSAQAASRKDTSDDVIDTGSDDSDSTLVETPEMKPKSSRKPRRPRQKPETDKSESDAPSSNNQEAAE